MAVERKWAEFTPERVPRSGKHPYVSLNSRGVIVLNLQPPFRVSRHIATPFTAWLVCERDLKGRFNVLAGVGKDVKTPFQFLAQPDHVLKHVAICPSGKPREGSLIIAILMAPGAQYRNRKFNFLLILATC